MTKTEKAGIEKWLNYVQYYSMRDCIALYEELEEKPSGSCKLKLNQTKTILNFIEYQRSVLEEW